MNLLKQYCPTIILNEQNKTKGILLLSHFCWFLYFFSSRFHLGEPVDFSFTEFEKSIPLMPWSIWVYVFLYPFNIVTFFLYKNEKVLNFMVFYFVVMQMIAFCIFMLFPVCYPIESFPLSEDQSLTTGIFSLVRLLDEPVNCFPSLHVANCYFISFGFLLEQKKKFLPWIILSTIISFSTLTTKQHYVGDIIFGLLLAVMIFWTGRKIEKI